jgi:hypothetical protein
MLGRYVVGELVQPEVKMPLNICELVREWKKQEWNQLRGKQDVGDAFVYIDAVRDVDVS